MATVKALRWSLEEMFLDAEQVAINSYAEWSGTEWVFNDSKWRASDQYGARIAIRARRLLGLKPFRYRGQEHPKGRTT